MIVWKHHIAEHFEQDPTLIEGNGAGIGGTVFRDFFRMKKWLAQNDARRFYVAPIVAKENQLITTEGEEVDRSLMANAKELILAVGPFAPIEWWESNMGSLQGI